MNRVILKVTNPQPRWFDGWRVTDSIQIKGETTFNSQFWRKNTNSVQSEKTNVEFAGTASQ
jgi:hypothetical protein